MVRLPSAGRRNAGVIGCGAIEIGACSYNGKLLRVMIKLITLTFLFVTAATTSALAVPLAKADLLRRRRLLHYTSVARVPCPSAWT